MIVGMDCHNQQVPIHCRVCGQRLTKYRAKKSISYECKVFSAELKIAFYIDTSGDDVNIHPEMFCKQCQLSMQRTISAIKKGVHYKCAVIVFNWLKPRMQGKQYTYALSKQTYDIMVFRYVSTSMHAQVDTRGGQQFVEVIRQASHLIY